MAIRKFSESNNMKINPRIPTDPVCFLRSLLVLILWIGMLLCPVAAAFGQQLYWSDFGGNSMANQSVGHVALDGTGSVVVHRTLAAFGMATNDVSRQAYWLEGAGSVITSDANLSNAHTLAPPTGSGGLNLAIDPAADLVLWAFSNSTIERTRLSDGAPIGSFATGGQVLEDIAVDPTSHKVYWTDANSKISRANYDGTSQELLAGSAGALGTGAAGIDLDLSAGKMYLAYPNLHTIVRRNLDGTNVETLLTLGATERPFSMELYAGRMYWCDNDNGLLRSATTGGADVKTILSGLDSPRAVSVLALAGDYNRNGIVDAADYTVWRDGLGSVYTQADYTVWKTNFGNHAGSGAGATTAVPEPATMTLCLMAIVIGGFNFRGRRLASRWQGPSRVLAWAAWLATFVGSADVALAFTTIYPGPPIVPSAGGFNSPSISGVNDSGTVIGVERKANDDRPYRWDGSGAAPVALGQSSATDVFGIDNSGTAVGQTGEESTSVYWPSSGTAPANLAIPAGWSGPAPFAINGTGTIVGAYDAVPGFQRSLRTGLGRLQQYHHARL